jgi:TonB family protein
MSQRNNFETAEFPPRAGSSGATSTGQDTFASEATNSRMGSPASRTRRPARIAVSLPVVLRDQFGGQHQARTQFVMLRGAIVASSNNLRVGHKLTVQNLKNGKSAECHVIGIEPGIAGSATVEVEFTGAQPDFWPVQFPGENATEGVSLNVTPTMADELTSLAGDISTPPRVTSSAQSPRITPSASSPSAANPRTSSPLSSAPAPAREKELVSLADSVEQNFPSPPAVHKPVPARTPPPTDSVAQFRAANRAAHRREQRMKTLYSIASVLALAALAFAGKTWLSHRPETIARPETISQPTKTAKIVAPAVPASNTMSASSAVANVFAHLKSAPSKVMARIKLPISLTKADPAPAEVVIPAPAEVDAKAVAEAQPMESQVAVRHGSSLASARKVANDPGEEPVALPLTASINPTSQMNPAALNAVVAQVPMKTAVLAPQGPRRLTPARLIFSTPAQYPPVARQLRTEGEVVINLDLDASGKVTDAKVVSGAPMLRTAALDAVRRWKYEPATLGDKPVPSTQTVKVDFRLK